MPSRYGLWNNGSGSSLLKTMKNPSGSHKNLVFSSLFASQSRHISNSNPQNTVFTSASGDLKTKIDGFCSNLLKPLNYPCVSHQYSVPSSSVVSNFRHFSSFNSKRMVLPSGYKLLNINFDGSCSYLLKPLKNPSGSCQGLVPSRWVRLFGSQAAVELATSDGLTVEGIIANQWIILDECDSDWKSHAAAIAQSIHLIKKRLQWKKLVVRLELLSMELDKPDIWNDPVHAGKISREHGSLMGKMKEVKAFEQQLLEHIDMIKLAREENDTELESVGPHFLF